LGKQCLMIVENNLFSSFVSKNIIPNKIICLFICSESLFYIIFT